MKATLLSLIIFNAIITYTMGIQCGGDTPYEQYDYQYPQNSKCIALNDCVYRQGNDIYYVFQKEMKCTNEPCNQNPQRQTPGNKIIYADGQSYIICEPCPFESPFGSDYCSGCQAADQYLDLTQSNPIPTLLSYVHVCQPIENLVNQGIFSSKMRVFQRIEDYPCNEAFNFMRNIVLNSINYPICHHCSSENPIFDDINSTKIKTVCLPSVHYCTGYISIDKTICLPACGKGQISVDVYSPTGILEGFKQCQCDSTGYYWAHNIDECFTTCPPIYVQNDELKTCELCPGILSFDKKSCENSCGQMDNQYTAIKYLDNEIQHQCICSTWIYENPDGVKECVKPWCILSLKTNQICLDICPGVISILNNECIQECPVNQIWVVKQINNVSQRQCICKNNLINCNGECLEKCHYPIIRNTITNEGNLQPQQCSYVISIDGGSCIYNCTYPLYQLYMDGYYKCVCPSNLYWSEQSQTCLEQCPQGSIIQKPENICLTSPEPCQKYISEDSQFCIDLCVSTTYRMIKTSTGQYFQCNCRYNSEDLKYCYLECPSDTIIDEKNAICLSGPEKCKSYVQNTGLSCVDFCDITSQVIQNTNNGITYSQCSCGNKFLNGHQGCFQSCPYGQIRDYTRNKCLQYPKQCQSVLSYDGKDCIKECSSELVKISNGDYFQCFCHNSTLYYFEELRQCYAECPIGSILFVSENRCESKVEKCGKHISIDGKKCIDTCDQNQISMLIKNETISYKKCFCMKESQFKSEDHNQCFDVCPPNTVVEVQQKICLSSPNKCTKFVSVSETNCIDQCKMEEIIQFKTINGVQYKQCTCDTSKYPYLSINHDACLTKCPRTSIKDIISNICLSHPEQCQHILSIDGQYCIKQCDIGQIVLELPSYKQCGCDSATPFWSITSATCLKQCPSSSLIQYPENICLAAPEDCQKSVSFVEKSCQKCNIDQQQVKVQSKRGFYWLCSKNSQYKYYFFIPEYDFLQERNRSLTNFLEQTQVECYDQGKITRQIQIFSFYYQLFQICVAQCPAKTIIDFFSFQCLAFKSECKFYLSIDGKLCIRKCDFGQINVQLSGYQQCKCDLEFPFYEEETQSCLKECPINTVINTDFQCLSGPEKCKKFVSFDGKLCINQCEQGQQSYQESNILGSYQKCTQLDIGWCLKYVSVSGFECLDQCNFGEIAIEKTEMNITYKKCICDSFPFLSIIHDRCFAKCPYDFITDRVSYKCLSNLNECLYYISIDGFSCINECSIGQLKFSMGQYMQCICPSETPYWSKYSGQCVVQCEKTNIIQIPEKICLSSPEQCQKYVSLDEQYCQNSCEQFYQHIQTMNGHYIQCSIIKNTKQINDNLPYQYYANIYYYQYYSFEIKNICFISLIFLQKNCQNGCEENEISKVYNQLFPECICTNKNLRFSYYMGCAEKCTSVQITDLTTNHCLLGPYQCGSVLSNDLKFCMEKCPIGQQPIYLADYGKVCMCHGETPYYYGATGECISACPPNMFIKMPELRCVLICISFVSVDKTTCVEYCGDNQNIAYGIIKGVYQNYCYCNYPKQFVSLYNQQCLEKCPFEQSYDVLTNQCLSSLEKCIGFVSYDSTQCLFRCNYDEIVISQQKNGIQYKQCVCDKTTPFKNEYLNCVECGKGLIRDYKLMKCYKKSEQCLRIVSVDNTRCEDTCDPPFVIMERIVLGDNIIFDKENFFHEQIGTFQQCSCPQETPYYQSGLQPCIQHCQFLAIPKLPEMICVQNYQFFPKTYINYNPARIVDQCGPNEHIIHIQYDFRQFCKCNFLSEDETTCYPYCPKNQYFYRSQCFKNFRPDLCQGGVYPSGQCSDTTLASTETTRSINRIYKDQIIVQFLCTENQVWVQQKKSCVDKRKNDLFSPGVTNIPNILKYECPENFASFIGQDNIMQPCISLCDESFPLWSEEQQICVNTCSQNEVLDQQNSICFTRISCPFYISVDGKYCTTTCDPDNFEVIHIGNQYYMQCGHSLYQQLNNQEKCKDGYIQDFTQYPNLCYLKPQNNCKWFLSVDKMQCRTQCEIGQHYICKNGYGQCFYCPPNKPYYLNNTCYRQCPNNFISNYYTKLCEDDSIINNSILIKSGYLFSQDLKFIYQTCKDYESFDIQTPYVYSDRLLICKKCDSPNLFLIRGEGLCVSQCNQITDLQNKLCISSPYECLYQNKMSYLGQKYCDSRCQKGEKYGQIDLQIITYCVACEETQFVSLDGTMCVDQCPSDQVADKINQQCVTSDDKCSNSTNIEFNNCGIGEKFIFVQGKSCKQCVSCAGDEFVTSDGGNCRNFCYSTEVADIINRRCLNSVDECTHILSANNKECSKNCGIGEIITTVEKKPYLQCVKCAKNEFIDIDNETCVGKCLSSYVGERISYLCPLSDIECNQKLPSNILECISLCQTPTIYLKCIICETGKYMSYDRSTCQSVCPSNEVTDKINNKCLLNANQCSNKISSDGKECIDKCACGEATVQNITEGGFIQLMCQPCSNYEIVRLITPDQPPNLFPNQFNFPNRIVSYYLYSISQATPSQIKQMSKCISQHQYFQNNDIIKEMQFFKITECSYKISQNMKRYVKRCPNGEELIYQGDISYTKCLPCEKGQFISSDESQCLNVCPQYQITDFIEQRCLDSPFFCNYIMSSDNLECTSQCKLGEIIQIIEDSNRSSTYYSNCRKCNGFLIANLLGTLCTYECFGNEVVNKLHRACLSSLNECSLYLSSNGRSCDITCPPGELPSTIGDTPFIQCIKCDITLLQTDLDIDLCQNNQCLSGFITDRTNSIDPHCLPSASFCKGFISSDGYYCDTKCQNGEIIDISSFQIQPKCIICEYDTFSSSDKTICLNECPSSEVTDVANHQCLKHFYYCKGFLSFDKKICGKTCPKGQKQDAAKPNHIYTQCSICKLEETNYNYDPQIPYQTYLDCFKCQTNYYISVHGIQCLQYCEENQITDMIQMKCLLNADSCTRKLSSDGLKCVTSCQIGEILVPVNGKSYWKCILCFSKQMLMLTDSKLCSMCIPNGVADEVTNSCLSSADQCKYKLTVDKKQCVLKCPIGQYSYTFNNDSYEQCIFCSQETPLFLPSTQLCFSKCPDLHINYNNICILTKDCVLNISIDGKRCTSECALGQYIVKPSQNSTYGQCKLCPSLKPISVIGFTDCTDQCPNGQIADEASHSCIQTISLCTLKLSVDKTLCSSVCKEDEIGFRFNPTLPYQECEKCPENIPYFLALSIKCIKKCDLIIDIPSNNCLKNKSDCVGYIQSDGISCNTSCNINEARTLFEDINSYYYCKICPQSFSPLLLGTDRDICGLQCKDEEVFDQKLGICIMKTNCSSYLSLDSKMCLVTCEKDQIIFQFSSQLFGCVNTCNSYSFIDSSGITLCVLSCPSNYITYEKNKTCLTSKAQCPDLISSDQKSCVQTCNKTNKEYIKLINNEYQLCSVCNYVYQIDGKYCEKKCRVEDIKIVEKGVCVPEEDIKGSCSIYKLSSDGKSCSEKCQQPDIEMISGVCKAPKCDSKKSSSCNECDEGQILDTGKAEKKCILPKQCGKFLTSDLTRCVDDCKIVKEIKVSDDKPCQACEHDQIFLIDSLGYTTCKSLKKVTIDEKKDTLTSLLSAPIESLEVSKDLKDLMSSVILEISDSLKNKSILPSQPSQKQDVSDKLLSINKLAVSFVQSLSTNLADGPQSIGDSESVLTLVQRKKDTEVFSRDLNVNEILKGKSITKEMTDPTNLNEKDNISYVATSVISTNPVCKTCTSPLVFSTFGTNTKARALSQDIDNRRNLGIQNVFSITFIVPEPSKLEQYVCIKYDLVTNAAVQLQTKYIPSDQLSCPLDGAVSFILDIECQYIKHSNCKTPQMDANTQQSPQTPEAEQTDSKQQISTLIIILGVTGFFIVITLTIKGIIYFYNRLKRQKPEVKYMSTENNDKQ